MRTAVFLDRDGVICQRRDDSVRSWQEFAWLPGSREAIARLHFAGIPVFVATNQSVINRGLVSLKVLNEIHARMLEDVQDMGGHITEVYFCPHSPEEMCSCRKPEPGMLLRAAKEHGVDLGASFMVGDSWSDIAAGRNAGTRTILVTTEMSYKEYLLSPNGASHRPDYVCADLLEAVNLMSSLMGLSR